MDTSKIIKGVVNGRNYTVTSPIVKEDYGLVLQIEGVELPPTYQVDFSNSENNGTSVTMIGNSDGVLIPHQFISTGKDVFAFLYHVGEDFGRTVYKFRIPNKLRPDRTDETPTPEEQSVIDQTISALNEAVESTQDAQEAIENMSVSATTLAEGSSATVTKTESEGVVHLEFGIPTGATGAKGDKGDKGDTGESPVTLHLSKDVVYVPMDREYRTKIAISDNIYYEYRRGDEQINGIMDYTGTLNGTNITCTNVQACTPTQKGYMRFTIPQGVPLRTNEDTQLVVHFRFVFDYTDLDGNRKTIARGIMFVGVMDGEQGEQGEPGAKGNPGDDGYSPTASVTKSGKVATITITDQNGTTTAQVEDGTDGTDGISPTVTITPITGGHRITITDADGEHSADVMDGTGNVDDVQIDGQSIVAEGVANVPIAKINSIGVVKVGATTTGIKIDNDGTLKTYPAESSDVKGGTRTDRPIDSAHQHMSTFYGLAKAAGDTTQSQSSNAVGNYTEDAKSAIQDMIGIDGWKHVAEETLAEDGYFDITIANSAREVYIYAEIEVASSTTSLVAEAYNDGGTRVYYQTFGSQISETQKKITVLQLIPIATEIKALVYFGKDAYTNSGHFDWQHKSFNVGKLNRFRITAYGGNILIPTGSIVRIFAR